VFVRLSIYGVIYNSFNLRVGKAGMPPLFSLEVLARKVVRDEIKGQW